MAGDRDSVDDIIEQWNREWPGYEAESRAMLLRLFRINAHLERQIKAIVGDHGLTFYGTKILTVLRHSGPPYRLTPGELSRRLYVMSGTLTHQLDQLEKAGLIIRRPDPNDRRGVLVELTASGRSRIDAALLAVNAQQRRLLAALSDEERAAAAAILRKLLLHFEDGAQSEPDASSAESRC